jgi:hypothetical protein
MGSTIDINATILPEKSCICQRLEGNHTALHIYAICATNCLRCRQFLLHACSTNMLTFQALANSRFFRHDCAGVNISCITHFLQADLFIKILSSIWLSQNFLVYNYIVMIIEHDKIMFKNLSRIWSNIL